MRAALYALSGDVLEVDHEPGPACVTFAGRCPKCGDEPFRVAGFREAHVQRGHDTITTDAGCVACHAHVGALVVTLDTIFGLEEDRAVLDGRARVYGGGPRQ